MSLHDPKFKYIPASDHSNAHAFRARQRARLRAAQATPVCPRCGAERDGAGVCRCSPPATKVQSLLPIRRIWAK